MKTNSITFVFYSSPVEKPNCRNMAVFQSCFSFFLLPPCYYQNICGRVIFIKFHAFRIFFSIPLDGCVWSLEIILWNASYFIHSNNIQTAPHCKNFWWNYNKNESCKHYLSNKEQKLLCLVIVLSSCFSIGLAKKLRA